MNELEIVAGMGGQVKNIHELYLIIGTADQIFGTVLTFLCTALSALDV